MFRGVCEHPFWVLAFFRASGDRSDWSSARSYSEVEVDALLGSAAGLRDGIKLIVKQRVVGGGE
jgi:hypothetical protein